MLSLLVLGTIVLVISAVASDPVLAASIEQTLGTAWTDAIGFLTSLVSLAG
jgi:hypothetical protein